MTSVTRADGTTEPFNCERIVNAILRETQLCPILFGTAAATRQDAEIIAWNVDDLVDQLGLSHITSHAIREIMCSVLLDNRHMDWYRVCTRIGMSCADAWLIDQGDGFESHDNANLKGNAETAHKKKADKLSKEQNLLLLPTWIAELHQSGDIHIHDLEYFGTRPFCADSDMRYLFYFGLVPSGDASTSAVARPAKNAEVAILHCVKWLGSAQTNFAGGQGFYNFLTFLSPYLYGKSYNQIKQLMQMFIYEMMQMYCARGGQVVFSSVQLSPGVPKIWRDKPAVYAGHVFDPVTDPDSVHWNYGCYEREVRLAFKALMEVMREGDAAGKPFSFPKPEIAIEPCFVYPDEFVTNFDAANPDLPTYDDLYRDAFALAAKFGTPYFDNMLPAYRGSGEGISCYQCCAYNFSTSAGSDIQFEDKMYFRNGAHFSMGSWLVVSLNCPRSGYESLMVPGRAAIDNLKQMMECAVDVFRVKRDWMKMQIEKGRIPFATQQPKDPNDPDKRAPPAIDLDGYVYTIGVVGLDDMVAAVMGARMFESKTSLQFGLSVVMEMKEYAEKLSRESGLKISVARTPAETTAQRFAMCDLRNERYRDFAVEVIQGDLGYALAHLTEADLPIYYTNGTHVPPNATISLTDRLVLESKFFPILDGGDIAHIWLGEAWTNIDGLYDFGMKIAKNTHIGYFAFTRDFTVCNDCGNLYGGIRADCVRCGSDRVDFISRITGYLSNVSGWNRAKKQELMDRQRVDL